MTDTKERSIMTPHKIVENWKILMAKSIEQEMMSTGYLRRIVLVLSMFKDRYQQAQKELNFVII